LIALSLCVRVTPKTRRPVDGGSGSNSKRGSLEPEDVELDVLSTAKHAVAVSTLAAMSAVRSMSTARLTAAGGTTDEAGAAAAGEVRMLHAAFCCLMHAMLTLSLFATRSSRHCLR
jgi:hypothetical protein